MDHTARSVAVILFIAAVAAAAIYCAQRRTVARGEVLAAQLVEANPQLSSLECDKDIPIGVDGATFACLVVWKSGMSQHVTFKLDREGRIEKTSDLPGD